MLKLIDKFDRVHDYLRVSLIDRCNLNCFYCNPKKAMAKSMPKKDIMSLEELTRMVKIFVVNHGFKKIRFTGGEPMLRKDIMKFFEQIYEIKRHNNFDIGLTSNGTMLAPKLKRLQDLGLNRINISLDTFDKNKFHYITGHDKIKSVLESIDEAEYLDFKPLKVNSVIMKGINDNEIIDFVDFAKNRNINVRFIEFMPFGNNSWQDDKFMSYKDIKNVVEDKYNLIAIKGEKNTVAKDYQIDNHIGKVSFISSISDHFCSTCNRLRVTASGKMKLCLFTNGGHALDFKTMFSERGMSNKEISNELAKAVLGKAEKHGAVQELITFDKNQMMTIGG